MTSDARSTLRRAQTELLAHLVGSGSAPVGFDGEALQRTRHSLRKKRARVLAQQIPSIVESLGDAFQSLFAEFASHHLPTDDADRNDGSGFIAFLASSGRLPQEEEPAWLALQTKTGWPIRVRRVTKTRIAIAWRWRKHVHLTVFRYR